MTNSTTRTTHLVGITAAVLMAVVVNGGMLLGFDSVAHEATLEISEASRAVVALETVTVVGRRS